MPQRIFSWSLSLLLLVASALSAQSKGPPSAWDLLTLEQPAPDVSPLERELLERMTPQQLAAYLNGTPPDEIILSNGETLAALLLSKGLGDFDVPWYSNDGGGGLKGLGGDFELGGTVGQADVAVMRGAGYTLRGGFWAVAEAGVRIDVPERTLSGFGTTVEVPLLFTSSGFEISAAAFSLEYDAACLGFDPTDADLDGNPDHLSFSLPPGFIGTATFTAGTLDIAIIDPITPLAPLPDGEVATLTFTTLCQPGETSILAAVGFADMPPPTFGDIRGQDVPGRSASGAVEILPGFPGDCNSDGILTAGDLSACVLEAFDGDDPAWTAAAGGTFPGSPIGCNANGDDLIDAGDLSCKVLLIFQGPGACLTSRSLQIGRGKPVLVMGRTRLEKRTDDGSLSVPIFFRARRWAINSLLFSIDFDEQAVAFDPQDADGDGLPDALRFELPASVQVTARFDPTDTDGELDISIFDPGRAIDQDTTKALLSIRFEPSGEGGLGADSVGFSLHPAASFGTLSGQSVAGTTLNRLKP